MATCPACGQAVEPDDNFCGHCGQRLAGTEATQQDRDVEDAAPDAAAGVDVDRTEQLVPVPGGRDDPATPPPAPRMDDTPPVPPEPSAPASDTPPDTPSATAPDDTPPVPATTARSAGDPDDDGRDDTGEISAVATEDSPAASTALFSAHPATSPNGAGADRRRPGPDPLDGDHASGAGDHTEVVSESGGVELATCPECEAINAIQRSRCARCGAALHGRVDTDEDDYELQELPSERAAAAPTTAPAAPRRRTRRTGLVIVALGIVVGGLIGTAFALGLGPFERGDVLAVDFDSEDYTSQPVRLSPTSVESSEVRADEDGRRFGPTQLVDGDTTTAWIATDPDRARLVFHFDAPVWITSVEVANGDQHGDEAFDATGRVRTLLVDMDHGSMLRATMLDGQGRQVIRPQTPVLTDRIAFEVVNVTDGDGVGLSELEFVGHVANESDAAAYRDAT